MSVHATGAVWSYSEQPPALRCLLVAIADRINRDYDNAYVKRSYLAGDVGIDPRSVTRWLTRLVAAGELVIVMDAGDTHGARYYIPIYPREPGYDPQPCDDPTHRCTGFHTPLEVSRHPRRDEAPRPPRPPRGTRPPLDTSVQGGLDTPVQGGLDTWCPGSLDTMCPGSTILAPSTPSETPSRVRTHAHEEITASPSRQYCRDLTMWRAVWRLLVAETPDAQQHWLSYGELYRDLDGSGPETRYILTLPSSAACEMVTQRWGERITQLLRRYNPTARLAAIVQPAALVA